jgi:hypothetical protein
MFNRKKVEELESEILGLEHINNHYKEENFILKNPYIYSIGESIEHEFKVYKEIDDFKKGSVIHIIDKFVKKDELGNLKKYYTVFFNDDYKEDIDELNLRLKLKISTK